MKRGQIIKDLALLFDMPQYKMQELIKGVPTNKLLEEPGLLVRECPEKYHAFARLKEAKPAKEITKLSSPSDVAEYIRGYAPLDLGVEQVVVMGVDPKMTILYTEIVSKGTVNSTIAHPREIFRRAILERAYAVFVAHNHPSGDPTPSMDDRALTQRLKDASQVIGIRLLDHVVVGDPEEYSFAKNGYLD